MFRKYALFLLALSLPLIIMGCSCLTCNSNDADFKRLTTWMTGSFGSEAQSKKDPEFFDIRLEMAQVWPERTDGYWLYVEQAVATALDKPYRQRVYRVTRLDKDTFESAVFELEEPLQYAGEWKKPNPLATLTPDDLIIREGASIYLKKTKDDTYEGSTRDKECKSNFRGASYATSEVSISAKGIYSWDRGFNDKDEQVWGAVKGGYIFDKK